MECEHGLRVLGKDGTRRLIDLRTALVRLAAADEAAQLDQDQYTTALAYPRAALMDCLDSAGRFRGYQGPAGPAAGFLPLDFDCAANPQAAITAAATVYRQLISRFEVHPESMRLCYSGSKGAHLYVPCPAGASSGFRRIAAGFVRRVATEAGAEILPDSAIYHRLQILRAPNSRHPATGSYKVLLTQDELDLPLTEIQAIAQRPRPFRLPDPQATPRLRLLWRAVEAMQARRAQLEAEHDHQDQPVRIMRTTTDFLARGVEVGQRAKRLYSAARNLCEAAVPIEAARGLLLPKARQIGLPTSEARRAIDCAFQA